MEDENSVATLADAESFPHIAGLGEEARAGAFFTMLYPSTQFVFAQDCMWWLNVLPLAADRSILEVGGCFPETVISAPDFEANAAAYYDRWEKVAREDMSILERQQRALNSVLYKPGPLSGRDDLVQQLGVIII